MSPEMFERNRALMDDVFAGNVSSAIIPRFTDFDGIAESLIDLATEITVRAGRLGTGYKKYDLASAVENPDSAISMSSLANVVRDALALMRVGIGPEDRIRPWDRREWDCWLLTYPPGVAVPEHVDPSPVEGKVHARINIVMRAPGYGGVLVIDGCKIEDLEVGDAVVFSSSRSPHSVEPCPPGRTRVVLSVGAVR